MPERVKFAAVFVAGQLIDVDRATSDVDDIEPATTSERPTASCKNVILLCSVPLYRGTWLLIASLTAVDLAHHTDREGRQAYLALPVQV